MSHTEKTKMADTPKTRAKKRTMDDTPPKSGEPYKLLSPRGTITLSSPPEMLDPKKRVTQEIDTEGTDEKDSTPQLLDTPKGQGQVTTNMAASEEVNSCSTVPGVEKDVTILDPDPQETKEGTKRDEQPEWKPPNQGKAPAK